MNWTVRMLIMTGAVIIAVGGMDGSKAAELDSRTAANASVADARRETQILTRFNANAQLRDYDLTVVVDGDKAALGGAVDSEAVRNLAGQIATDAGSIRHVDNRIRVEARLVSPRHTVSTPVLDAAMDDAALATAVKSRLLWNEHTEGLAIRVDTREGRVTLAGSSISYAERDMAGIVAGNTAGVVHVDNELVLTDQVRPVVTGEDGKAPSDSWITSRVKSSLLLTRGVSRSGIGVTTSNGIVSLRGLVASKAERELAMQVAQDVRGVRQVDADGLGVG